MSAAAVSKIHIANSTGLSLNERFTAMASKPEPRRRSRSRSRSRSRQRDLSHLSPNTSTTNRRLLQQLAKRYMMQAALKLKRRSMRTVGAVRAGAVNGVKALRVGVNGRPIKTNNRNRIATMNADFVKNRGRPLRRSNSVSNRIGRPLPGGAAERVARRRLERLAGDGGRKPYLAQRGRSRSRSRSRTRLPRPAAAPVMRGRARSRSRSRTQQIANAKSHVPIKNRLGIRSGNATNQARGRRNSRNLAVNGRAVADGRVRKRSNINGAGGAQLRGRSRSRVRRGVNPAERSRSRTRRGSVGQQNRQQQQNRPQQQNRQQRSGAAAIGGRRGRRGLNQAGQKRQNGGKFMQKTGNNTNGSNPGAQRRGRSRSRGQRNGAKNLGKNNARPNVKKEDLDKELDQYMSSTKTDEMDYLLKN